MLKLGFERTYRTGVTQQICVPRVCTWDVFDKYWDALVFEELIVTHNMVHEYLAELLLC